MNYKSRLGLVFTAWKNVDETRNDTTTTAIDANLQLPTRASQNYFWELFLFINSHTTPDFKYSVEITSGNIYRNTTNDTISVQDLTTAVTDTNVTSTGNNQMIHVYGKADSGNAGTIALHWAQQTTSSEDTKVLTSSILRIWEIN